LVVAVKNVSKGIQIMNRRSLIALPGIAAFAASQAFGQTQETASDGVVAHVSSKALAKHSGSKASYKVPKSAGKQARYLNSLTALLSLSTAQQQQAATILAGAANARISVHSSLKAARKALSQAVKSNDTGAITQSSTALGSLTSQHISYGALANAALFQLLTPDQQTKLSLYQG
jgi:Spy/CpxP family protein refolding chaperone